VDTSGKLKYRSGIENGDLLMNRKILVVDDEKSIRDLYASAFSDAGYDVHLAENGEAALDILGGQEIELIFLDLKLFGMNGIELCRQIRKTRPIAIIYAITGWSGLFEIEECREAGFDDYFKKPIELDILFKSVEDAFEKLDRWKRRYPVT
jgi:CheY-like chemotaxis protein